MSNESKIVEELGEKDGLSRRGVLAGAVVVGGAWAAPAVLSLDRAHAVGSPPPNQQTTLRVNKSGPGAAFTNQTFTWKIEVTNDGLVAATNVVITDTPPDGIEVVSTNPNVGTTPPLTWNIPSLAPGATTTVSFNARAAQEGTYINTASAKADNTPVAMDSDAVQVGIQAIVTGGAAAAGTGLRNRHSGDITITGIPAGASVTRAVLVWAILFDPPTTPSNQITFQGTPQTANLTQTISGTLCWGDDATVGYAADVTSLVTGNGVYTVSDAVNGAYHEDDNPVGVLPYTDGASLIVFYGGPGIDGQVLSTFQYGTNTAPGNQDARSFAGINSVGGASRLILAGPDGQGNFDETTTITGSGSLFLSNMFNGSDPQSGPLFSGGLGSLWDTDPIDVTTVLPAGQTTLSIDVSTGADCIGISAAVLIVEQ